MQGSVICWDPCTSCALFMAWTFLASKFHLRRNAVSVCESVQYRVHLRIGLYHSFNPSESSARSYRRLGIPMFCSCNLMAWIFSSANWWRRSFLLMQFPWNIYSPLCFVGFGKRFALMNSSKCNFSKIVLSNFIFVSLPLQSNVIKNIFCLWNC